MWRCSTVEVRGVLAASNLGQSGTGRWCSCTGGRGSWARASSRLQRTDFWLGGAVVLFGIWMQCLVRPDVVTSPRASLATLQVTDK